MYKCLTILSYTQVEFLIKQDVKSWSFTYSQDCHTFKDDSCHHYIFSTPTSEILMTLNEKKQQKNNLFICKNICLKEKRLVFVHVKKYQNQINRDFIFRMKLPPIPFPMRDKHYSFKKKYFENTDDLDIFNWILLKIFYLVETQNLFMEPVLKNTELRANIRLNMFGNIRNTVDFLRI